MWPGMVLTMARNGTISNIPGIPQATLAATRHVMTKNGLMFTFPPAILGVRRMFSINWMTINNMTTLSASAGSPSTRKANKNGTSPPSRVPK